jgi:hypothetical protein
MISSLKFRAWAIILLFTALHEVTDGAISLHELGKEEVKFYGIAGKLYKGEKGTINVEIEIGKTSTLRRGLICLNLDSSDGPLKFTWQIKPSHPLIVKFTIPRNLATKSYLVFMTKDMSDPDQELYDRCYVIDLGGKLLFGGDNPVKEQKIKNEALQTIPK